MTPGLKDAIERLCASLSGATAAADDIAREVGDVVERQDGALRVRPRDERFSDAYIVTEADGEVAHVELELRAPGSLDALAVAFGEYTTPPALHPGERRAVFYVERPSQPATCAVIARLARAGTVTGVTIRRDA